MSLSKSSRAIKPGMLVKHIGRAIHHLYDANSNDSFGTEVLVEPETVGLCLGTFGAYSLTYHYILLEEQIVAIHFGYLEPAL